jgi:hypothetical protein
VRALPGNLAARGYEILAAESDAPVRPGEASR